MLHARSPRRRALARPARRSTLPWVMLVAGLAVHCRSSEPASPGPGTEQPDDGPTAQTPQGFIRAQGRALVDEQGDAVTLRGVAFGNNVWGNPTTPPRFHHAEVDYERVRAMGMNAVRFYLNYALFAEEDTTQAAPFTPRPAGFDWLDQNIAWAKAHGVVLLLNLHVPPGGFQSNGEGAALWQDAANQERFVALWRELATRYADEPTIAGYDLLNEPRPTESKAQWQALAERAAQSIREVDRQHLLVVERVLSAGNTWTVDSEQNFVVLPDDNVLYEFHFYSPIEYTHQLADWLDFGDGGTYPDEGLVAGALTWHSWSWDPLPPVLPPGDSDWQEVESPRYAISDPAITVAQPVLVSELNQGTAWFDRLVVREYDADGQFVRNVIEDDLEDLEGFTFWKEGAEGAATRESDCVQGGCLAISGTDHDANLQNPAHRFIPRPHHTYSVGGFMRGVGTSADSRPDPRGDWTQVSRALFRLDFYSGAATGRTRAALAAELAPIVAWGERRQVPLYLGEFGVIRHCFEGDKGGLRWVGDMLDLAREHQLSFTYHSYHEVNFPIYQSPSDQTLPRPEDAVPGLVELFQDRLGAPSE